MSVRYPSTRETSIQPATVRDGSGWRAQVRDVSQGGIGLVVNRRFEPGTLLVIELDTPGPDDGRTFLARVVRVVHATARPESDWLLGCAFAAELEDEDLRLFCAERVRAEASDCRAWVRFPCEVDTVAEAPDEDALAVRVVNVSPRGVGLVAPVPLEVGTCLQIELPSGPGQPPRTAPIRVVQPGIWENGGWLLGCEFAGQLNEDDLERMQG
jgi:hypothetical protein